MLRRENRDGLLWHYRMRDRLRIQFTARLEVMTSLKPEKPGVYGLCPSSVRDVMNRLGPSCERPDKLPVGAIVRLVNQCPMPRGERCRRVSETLLRLRDRLDQLRQDGRRRSVQRL